MSSRVAVRAVASHVVWACCAAVALLLAVAALLVGLRVDEESAAGLAVRAAEWVDLPYVARGESWGGVIGSPVSSTVAAWGVAAAAWLAAGAAVAHTLRPRNE